MSARVSVSTLLLIRFILACRPFFCTKLRAIVPATEVGLHRQRSPSRQMCQYNSDRSQTSAKSEQRQAFTLRIDTRHAITERQAQNPTTPIHPSQTHTMVLPTEPAAPPKNMAEV